MSKTSLIIGCIVAVALHGLLWLPLTRADSDQSKAAEQSPPKAKLAMAPEPPPKPTPVPPEPVPKPKPKPEPEPEPKPEPVKKVEPKPQVKPTPPLQEVVKAPVKTPDPAPKTPEPADASKNEDDNALPPLRIVWSSAGEVRSVARALGLRLVAMNAAGQAVGEIDTRSGKWKEFTGRLDQYSNRVRTLPRTFFGLEVVNAPGRAVARFWILVPAGIDRQWMALQRSAVAQRGMKAAQVREVEARFTGAGGSPRLSVVRVHGREG